MRTLHPLLALRRALSLISHGTEPVASGSADETGEPGSSPTDPLATAISLCLADNWVEGRDVLRRFVRQDSHSARAWRALGLAHGRLGDWRRAQDALARAHVLGPEAATAELLDEVRQVRRWQRAITRRPWDVEARVQYGALLMAWERGDEAIDHLRRAVELKPDWAPAHLYLGLELHYRGLVDEAERCYLEAMVLAPEDETARNYLDALRTGVLPGEDTADERGDPWAAALAS